MYTLVEYFSGEVNDAADFLGVSTKTWWQESVGGQKNVWPCNTID